MFHLINYCQGIIPLLVQDSDRVFFFNLIHPYCSSSGSKCESLHAKAVQGKMPHHVFSFLNEAT